MSFQLFTPLFNKIDSATRTITAITPAVSSGLTLAFIAYGILILRGVVALPVMEFLKKSIQISIITSIALGAGLYQSTIAELIRTTPDELVTSLISNSSEKTEEGAASIIDQSAEIGFGKASEAFEKAGFFYA